MLHYNYSEYSDVLIAKHHMNSIGCLSPEGQGLVGGVQANQIVVIAKCV